MELKIHLGRFGLVCHEQDKKEPKAKLNKCMVYSEVVYSGQYD